MSYSFSVRGVEVHCNDLDDLEAALEKFVPEDKSGPRLSPEAAAYRNDLQDLGAEETARRREANDHLKRRGRKNPENTADPSDPFQMTPRERQAADLMLVPPPEQRKPISEAAEIMNISYEMARIHRASAARKMGISLRKVNREKLEAPKPPDPDGLSKIERFVADRMLVPEERRQTHSEVAQALGIHFRGVIAARTRAIAKLGLNPADFAIPERPPPNGIERFSRRDIMTWDSQYFRWIAFADPTFTTTPSTLIEILNLGGVEPPDELRDVARGFRLLTFIHRLHIVKRAKATVEFWRRGWNTTGSCQFCEGLAHRRPCPGVCPVCGKPGEREVLERPEILRSSAGMLTEDGDD